MNLTVEEIRNQFGLDLSDDIADALVSNFGTQAVEAVESMYHKTFAAGGTTVTEYHDGKQIQYGQGQRTLVVDNYPIISVTTLKVYDSSGNLSQSFTSDDYWIYPDSGEIIIQGDDSITNIKNAILKTVNNALSDTMSAEGANPALKVTSDPIYGKDADFIDFFVPGILAFVVYLLTTILTLITFVGEKSNGTLERVLASPVTEGEVVMGYAITFGTFGIIQVALLFSIAVLVFNIIVVGNVLLAFLAVAILAVACQALGILLSSLAKRPEQAIQFFPFVILPAFLLSGVFWPIQAIPEWLRPFSYLIPPTYAVEACRAVMLKGWGLDRIWPDLVILVIFTLLFMLLATYTLRRGKN